MGRFATMAEEHWKTWKPQSYAQLADKDTFFRELEDEAYTQIWALAEALGESDPSPGDSFADTIGRNWTARLIAESEVIRDMILVEPDPA